MLPRRRFVLLTGLVVADIMSSSSSEVESSDSGDFESDEIEMYETEATYKIDSGILVAKNSDGTYRCPFSPNRKKQSFRHQDLLAHARGIARGKKGPLKVGNHRALVKYLSAELGDRPEFKQAERVRRLQQAVPPRVAKEEKRLCPWMGIVVNIDNRETREEDGFRVAAGAADIKEKFHVLLSIFLSPPPPRLRVDSSNLSLMRWMIFVNGFLTFFSTDNAGAK